MLRFSGDHIQHEQHPLKRSRGSDGSRQTSIFFVRSGWPEFPHVHPISEASRTPNTLRLQMAKFIEKGKANYVFHVVPSELHWNEVLKYQMSFNLNIAA